MCRRAFWRTLAKHRTERAKVLGATVGSDLTGSWLVTARWSLFRAVPGEA